MNIPDSVGESSSKRQEDGDVSIATERPLKKARFAWQVKGKYHLKNETADSDKILHESEKANTSSANRSDSNILGGTEQNLEILGDYLLKQDFNTLDSVITDTSNSVLKSSTDLSSEKIQFSRSRSLSENNTTNSSILSTEEHVTIPMSLVSRSYSEDQCIARWQARQMAKGFVDNTINRVLDSWMVAPIRVDMLNDRVLALDVAEFINNLPGDNSIENEGILMAISAHGLQNTLGSTSNDKYATTEKNHFNNKDPVIVTPPSSPRLSDDETVVSYKDTKDSCMHSFNDLDLSWSQNINNANNDSVPDNLYPDTSSSSHEYTNESNHQDGSVTNHYDFLDTAISFAIKNKGLTSFSTDYG